MSASATASVLQSMRRTFQLVGSIAATVISPSGAVGRRAPISLQDSAKLQNVSATKRGYSMSTLLGRGSPISPPTDQSCKYGAPYAQIAVRVWGPGLATACAEAWRFATHRCSNSINRLIDSSPDGTVRPAVLRLITNSNSVGR